MFSGYDRAIVDTFRAASSQVVIWIVIQTPAGPNGVSNCWIEIWNETMDWKMEWLYAKPS